MDADAETVSVCGLRLDALGQVKKSRVKKNDGLYRGCILKNRSENLCQK